MEDDHLAQLLQLMQCGKLAPLALATHTFPLGDTMAAYDTFGAPATTHALKVVLQASLATATCRAAGRRQDVAPPRSGEPMRPDRPTGYGLPAGMHWAGRSRSRCCPSCGSGRATAGTVRHMGSASRSSVRLMENVPWTSRSAAFIGLGVSDMRNLHPHRPPPASSSPSAGRPAGRGTFGRWQRR
jgi:hypothetical protein